MVGRPPKRILRSDASAGCGRWACALRLRKKLSVAEASQRAGGSEQTWHAWEKGRDVPLDALPKMAKAVGCRVRLLLPDE